MNHRKIAWNALNYGPSLAWFALASGAAFMGQWYTAVIVAGAATVMAVTVSQTKSWFAIGYSRGRMHATEEIFGNRERRPLGSLVPEPWEAQMKVSQIMAMPRDYTEDGKDRP